MKYRYFKNHIFRQIILWCLIILAGLLLYDGIFIRDSKIEIILSAVIGFSLMALSIFQFITDHSTLCVKDLNNIIEQATSYVVDQVKHEKTPITYYTHSGAIDINPRHLAIWYSLNLKTTLHERLRLVWLIE